LRVLEEAEIVVPMIVLKSLDCNEQECASRQEQVGHRRFTQSEVLSVRSSLVSSLSWPYELAIADESGSSTLLKEALGTPAHMPTCRIVTPKIQARIVP
jgi:hypothetical protein